MYATAVFMDLVAVTAYMADLLLNVNVDVRVVGESGDRGDEGPENGGGVHFEQHLFSRATKACSARDPHHHDVDVDVEKEVGHVCGNGNKVHCCNSETAVGGLLGLNLDNILSGCQEINIPVLAVNVPFKDVCTQQAICCGDVKQKGLFNLGCTPVTL